MNTYNLAMIEQPCDDDLHEHARLQERIATDVCLDESVKSLANARQASNCARANTSTSSLSASAA